MAGHGDNYYEPVSKEEALKRIERGRRERSVLSGKVGKVYTPAEITALRKHAGLDLLVPGHEPGEWPQCCKESELYIRWRQRGHIKGPNVDGWALDLYNRGSHFREAVLFCPWCGARLEP